MLKLTSKDYDKQFISIVTNNVAVSTDELLSCLIKKFPVLKNVKTSIDREEILFEVDENTHFGFSLNELRNFISNKARTGMFYFDDEKNERCDIIPMKAKK